jgi:FAD:protein FMN transferase
VTGTTRNRAVQLDFGAFAKGHVAQLGGEHLRGLGIDNAIVAVAGDIRALGTHGERAWRVGIRHPRAAGILAATELHDGESISTSGDYERYFTYENRRYHHLLDPRTGHPADGAVSVTVIARTAQPPTPRPRRCSSPTPTRGRASPAPWAWIRSCAWTSTA